MQSYINRVRINSEIRNTKVEYPGRIAYNNSLYPAGNVNPNFENIDYVVPNCKPCTQPPPPPP